MPFTTKAPASQSRRDFLAGRLDHYASRGQLASAFQTVHYAQSAAADVFHGEYGKFGHEIAFSGSVSANQLPFWHDWDTSLNNVAVVPETDTEKPSNTYQVPEEVKKAMGWSQSVGDEGIGGSVMYAGLGSALPIWSMLRGYGLVARGQGIGVALTTRGMWRKGLDILTGVTGGLLLSDLFSNNREIDNAHIEALFEDFDDMDEAGLYSPWQSERVRRNPATVLLYDHNGRLKRAFEVDYKSRAWHQARLDRQIELMENKTFRKKR